MIASGRSDPLLDVLSLNDEHQRDLLHAIVAVDTAPSALRRALVHCIRHEHFAANILIGVNPEDAE